MTKLLIQFVLFATALPTAAREVFWDYISDRAIDIANAAVRFEETSARRWSDADNVMTARLFTNRRVMSALADVPTTK